MIAKKMKLTIKLLLLIAALSLPTAAQKLTSPKIGTNLVPDDLLIKIAKAEDARDAAPVIDLLANTNSATRFRAALAAGRIGDDKALPGLTALLSDAVLEVRAMAAFAI